MFKFVTYCVIVKKGNYQTRNILTECLSHVRYHGPFCESAAYIVLTENQI